MSPELQEWLAQAQRAIAKGASIKDVDAKLAKLGRPAYKEMLTQLRAAPKDKPGLPVSMLDQLHSAASGATLSGFDDIIGRGLLMDPTVAGNLKARGAQYAKDQPGADLSARMGGAAALGLATAPLFPGAAAPITRAAIGTGLGAAEGGIQAAFEGRPVTEGAGTGALFGLGGAAAAEALTGGLPAVSRLAQSIVAPEAAGISAGRASVREAAQAAGLGTSEFETLMNQLESARPGLGVPADASPAFQRLARANVNEAAGDVTDVIRGAGARAEGGAERLAQDARQLSGVGNQSTAAAKGIAQTNLRAEAKKLYQPLEELYDTIEPSAKLQAVTSADIAGKPIWNAVKPERGKGLPGFKHYQAFMEKLEDKIEAAKRAGAGNEMADLIDLKNRAKLQMEDAFPGYQAASRGYAQSLVGVKAFDRGSQAYRRAMSGPAIKEELNALLEKAGPKAEEARDAYRLGMVNQMVDDLVKKAGKPNAARGFVAPAGTLSGRANAIKVVFPNGRGEFEEFIKRAVAEDKIAATSRALTGNSTTAQQMGDMQRLRAAMGMDINSIIPAQARRAQANTINEMLLGRNQKEVSDLLQPRSRFQPSLGVAGATGGALTLKDYLERGQ